MRFDEIDGEPLAHMAMNDDVVASLREPVRAASASSGGRDRSPASRRAAARSRRRSTARLRPTARLLIAADGARSQLRAVAGIATVGWDYGQSAIVATIAHERDHHGRAEQHFLPAGPFAILPLPGRRSSDRLERSE